MECGQQSIQKLAGSPKGGAHSMKHEERDDMWKQILLQASMFTDMALSDQLQVRLIVPSMSQHE